MILDAGLNLTLRPMKYPIFFEMYKAAIKNTWTVEEVDFSTDIVDMRTRMKPSERHLIHRLIAFFATGDSVVSNNLVLNLYKHINSPEARVYLSRQLYEEALHIEFYLTLLDTYLPDLESRALAFAAIERIPSIKKKGDFCFKWLNSIYSMEEIRSRSDRQQFLLNLICFASCIEGLFFFGAFAYVFFLRSKGLLNGLATGTNWVFRDESAHIAFAYEVIATIRREEPSLFDAHLKDQVVAMVKDAVECELLFASDALEQGVAGLSVFDMRQYLQFIADRRLISLEIAPVFGSRNPFGFMDLQDVQELANFFERRVSAYQVSVVGKVAFGEDF